MTMHTYEFKVTLDIIDRLQELFPTKMISITKEAFSRIREGKQIVSFEYILYIEDVDLFRTDNFGSIMTKADEIIEKHDVKYRIRKALADHNWDKYFSIQGGN